MSRRVLFVASLHHPEQYLQELKAVPPGAPLPLFPTSMSQHFWERAMLRRGYTLRVFWRNLPTLGGGLRSLRAQHHSQQITPSKLVTAALRRLPAKMNPDYRQRNTNLVRAALEFAPDWLWLVGDNTIIYDDTLAEIKQATGCQILYVSGTSPIVFAHPIERAAARLYDYALVNDFYHGIQWQELGTPRMICLPIAAADPDFHRPLALPADERERYACDVTFVGTLVPPNLYSERVAALEALRRFELGIWSVHDVPPSLRPYLRGYALGEQMFRVLAAAAISLNTHGDFMRYGGNQRLFEAAAVGAFQIVDDRPGIPTWFTPGEHLVMFRDYAELRDQVAYYLAHPAERARIAEAARAHVLAQHTFDHRLARLEALVGGE